MAGQCSTVSINSPPRATRMSSGAELSANYDCQPQRVLQFRVTHFIYVSSPTKLSADQHRQTMNVLQYLVRLTAPLRYRAIRPASSYSQVADVRRFAAIHAACSCCRTKAYRNERAEQGFVGAPQFAFRASSARLPRAFRAALPAPASPTASPTCLHKLPPSAFANLCRQMLGCTTWFAHVMLLA